jgi:hypothetical protein
LDDAMPVLVCELSDYLNFDETPPEIIAKDIAQAAARTAMENGMTGAGNAGGDDSKKIQQGCGKGAGCNWKLIVTWHTSSAQGKATFARGGPSTPTNGICGGPCGCSGGCPSCFGTTHDVCYSFASRGSAQEAGNYWTSTYGKSINEYWNCSESGVVAVSVQEGTHTGPGAAECSSGGGPGGGATGGQTSAPTGLDGSEPFDPNDPSQPRDPEAPCQ